ncbi:MAG: DsbE family thiol:disulfide interchange protein [Porticoccaceae bacterium]
MERFKLFIPLLIFILLAVALYFGLDRDPSAMPSALIDKLVPAFTLPSLADKEKSLNDVSPDEASPNEALLTERLFQGEAALLNVWATWCVSCRMEHGYLMDLAKLGVPIVGLNYKDERGAAQRWLVELGDPYREVIFDAEGSLGLDLGVFGAPETYVVDGQGMIRYKYVGVVDERVWQQKIAPVFHGLQESPTP